MSESSIREDMQALAGRLAHRGPNTDMERSAAEYVCERMKASAPDTEIDDFYSIDTPWFLFASYYGEFMMVSLIAMWWPRLALCYGAGVFLAYLAEFTGHEVMGRFLPHFETQNVVARMLAPRPRRLIVVMAHGDSPKVGPLEDARIAPWLYWMHNGVLACMLVVVGSCAVEALGTGSGYETVVRWWAACVLLAAAAAVAYNAWAGEYTRGANDNASGVSALLSLADCLAANPLSEADVCLVVTGSNGGWMAGARRFVNTETLDPETTRFLDLDRVGVGALAYTTGLGPLRASRCSKEMIDAAATVAEQYGAVPHRRHTACSDALIPLIRGYPMIEITGIDTRDAEQRGRHQNDALAQVDYALVERAADFAEAVLRRIAGES